MSEKIYAWLLRLYPCHFREEYEHAALQLFRDRSRHERGFLPSLRLWLDLLADLAISIPGQYHRAQPALTGASVEQCSDGSPSFYILKSELPRPGALVLGGVLSLVLAGAAISIGRLQYARPSVGSAFHYQRGAYAPRATRIGPTKPPARHEEDTLGLVPPAATEDLNLDAVERQRVIRAAAATLKRHYIDPDVGQRMADVLLGHEERGDDDAATGGKAFADLLTRQMRDVSHDMHLVLVYSQVPLPDRAVGPTSEGIARYRRVMEQENCTFEKVETSPHNIGYLKLDSFPDPDLCRATARATMASLNRSDAIILDLRDNSGGFPSMVMLIAAYLFDHPEYMYNPRENTTQQSWTQSPVPGNRLADKPVYVLISAKTVSGAEQFSYDLRMLKRVTLVGETTRGSAHSGVWYRLDDHFGMGIPETRPINPFSKTDWEGIGVAPDVKVRAADALETAVKLAEDTLRKK